MDQIQLLEDYRNKMFVKDLQLKYNLSWKKLTKILKENGVYQKSNSLKYSDDVISYIKENYLILASKQIAKNLHINEDWVRETAKKLSLPIKGNGWKYNIDIENLDLKSNEFYYFLGWIASDGNISKNFMTISLKISDNEIINKFKILFPNENFYFYKKEFHKDMYQLNIGSKKLALYLNSLGITPNKSKTLKVNDEIWNSHFVRGFFEGDGHVRISKSKYIRYEAGFVTGSENFKNQLVNFLQNNLINVKVSIDKSCFRIRISGKDNLKNFYILLYSNCDNWFLTRKKEILDQLFSNK